MLPIVAHKETVLVMLRVLLYSTFTVQNTILTVQSATKLYLQ